MMYLELIGRLGADSELKTSKNGNQFVSMRVASNDFIGGENITTWVSVLWPSERAIKMAEHMKKGSQVIIHGTPKYSTYQKNNGEVGIDVSVLADRVDFVSSGNSGNTQTTEAVAETGTLKKQEPKKQTMTVEKTNDDADDLPF